MGKLSLINGFVGQSEQSITDEIRQRTEMAKPRPYIHFSKLNSADATKSLLIDHYNASKAIQPENKNLYNKALTAIYKWNPADKAVSGIGVMPDELQGLANFLAKASEKSHLPALRSSSSKVGEINASSYDTNFSPQTYVSFTDSSRFDYVFQNAATSDAQGRLALFKGGATPPPGIIDPNSGIALGKGSATDATNNQTGTETGKSRVDGFNNLSFSLNLLQDASRAFTLYGPSFLATFGSKNSISPSIVDSLKLRYPSSLVGDLPVSMSLFPGLNSLFEAQKAIIDDQFYLNMASDQPKYRVSGFQAYERFIEALNLADAWFEVIQKGGDKSKTFAGKWLIGRGQETNFKDYLHAPIFEKYINETLTSDYSTSLGLYGFVGATQHPTQNRKMNANDLNTATAIKYSQQTALMSGISSFTGFDEQNAYLMSRTGILRKTANQPDAIISGFYSEALGGPRVGAAPLIITLIPVFLALLAVVEKLIVTSKKDAQGISSANVPNSLLGLNPAAAANPGEDFKANSSSNSSSNNNSNPLKGNNGLIYGAGAALIGLLLLNNK